MFYSVLYTPLETFNIFDKKQVQKSRRICCDMSHRIVLTTQLAFSYSKLTIETVEQGVKNVQI